LQLLAGLPIEVNDVGSVYPLKLREIAQISETKYNNYLGALLFDLEDVEQYHTIENIDKLNSFDILCLFCIQDDSFKNVCLDAIKCFFKKDSIFIKDHMIFVVGDINEKKILHRNNFEQLKNILRKQNCIKQKREEEYNPANAEAEEFIKEIEKKNKIYAKIKKKDDITLYSIISSIAWKSHIGINAVWDLTIYQLYDAYHRLGLIDNYDKTMHGIYSGTIDSKKIKLKEIDWSKDIGL